MEDLSICPTQCIHLRIIITNIISTTTLIPPARRAPCHPVIMKEEEATITLRKIIITNNNCHSPLDVRFLHIIPQQRQLLTQALVPDFLDIHCKFQTRLFRLG